MADTSFSRLSTPRLVLRRLRESDLASFCRYRSDPRVARYQSWTEFREEDGLRFFAEQADLHPDVEGTWFQMAIELAESAEIIGDCGSARVEGSAGTGRDRLHAGDGISGKRLCDRGGQTPARLRLRELHKHRATAITDARNAAAARVLERGGDEARGTLHPERLVQGRVGGRVSVRPARTRMARIGECRQSTMSQVGRDASVRLGESFRS